MSTQIESCSNRNIFNPNFKLENYDVIIKIGELFYYDFMTYVLFKCDYFDVNNSNTVDEYGFTLINTNNSFSPNEPYVLNASQV